MTPEASNKLQNMFLAFALGIIVPPAIGFGTGMWVLKDNAERKASQDLVSAYSSICIAQFNSTPTSAARLKEFKAIEYGAQSTYLEKGGWAKMPGQEKVNDAVLRGCIEKLNSL